MTTNNNNSMTTNNNNSMTTNNNNSMTTTKPIALLESPLNAKRSKLVNTLSDTVRVLHAVHSIDDAYRSIIRDDKNDFVCFESPDKVSYAPSPKHKYNESRRVVVSLARYLTRRQGLSCESHLLEDFVGAYTSYFLPSSHGMETLSGSDISDAYKEAHNFCRSCMTGDRAKNIMMYEDNPSKVSLIIARNHRGQLVGRSLLWSIDGELFYDRIYCTCSITRSRMNRYVVDMGYKCAAGTGLIVHLDRPSNDSWPYMDTFVYAKLCVNNRVRLSNTSNVSYDACLDSQYGGFGEDNDEGRAYCECCEESTDADNVSYVEREERYVCHSCLEYYYVVSDIDRDYIHQDDAVETVDGLTVHSDEIVDTCESCDLGSTESLREVENVNGGSRTVCSNCIENDSDIVICPCCSELISIA